MPNLTVYFISDSNFRSVENAGVELKNISNFVLYVESQTVSRVYI